MQERLTAVLRTKTAAPTPEVTVITDGGNGVQHLHRLLPGKVHSMLDWFHVRCACAISSRSSPGCAIAARPNSTPSASWPSWLASCDWHFWHANVEKAWDRLWGILTLCRIVVPETDGLSQPAEAPRLPGA